jgi:protein SCO1
MTPDAGMLVAIGTACCASWTHAPVLHLNAALEARPAVHTWVGHIPPTVHLTTPTTSQSIGSRISKPEKSAILWAVISKLKKPDRLRAVISIEVAGRSGAPWALRVMVSKRSRLVVGLMLAALTLWPACPGVAAEAVTIGGPFTLRTPDGTTVTDQTYRGKWLLVYFGYTFCPNTCPTALMDISLVLAKLGGEADALQPLFISVDPQRDTPDVLQQYTRSFDPRIIGLSGDPQQIADAAQAYGAYYSPHPIDQGAKDYLIDHSSYVYLMDPSGHFARGFDADTPPDRMAQEVRELMRHATGTGTLGN